MPKALSASEMELGELVKEVVCPELCCGAGLTALQAPSVLLPPQVLQGACRLENWSPGLRGEQPSVGTCRQQQGFFPCPRN